MSAKKSAEGVRRARAGLILMPLGVALAAAGLLAGRFTGVAHDTWEVPLVSWPTLLLLMGAATVALGLGLFLAGRARRLATSLGLLTPDEEERVLDAVRLFESRTSGEIRVHLAQRVDGDVLAAARGTFERIGMTETAEKNGVLFFVAVASHRYAVIGDSGIDARVPEGFWDDCVARVGERFAEKRFADGLIEGIGIAGAALAEYFPVQEDDVNELPDEISRS